MIKNERIAFRTTKDIKALIELMAKAENRSVSNFLENLISSYSELSFAIKKVNEAIDPSIELEKMTEIFNWLSNQSTRTSNPNSLDLYYLFKKLLTHHQLWREKLEKKPK